MHQRKEAKHLVWHRHELAFLQDTFGVQKNIKPCGLVQVFPFFSDDCIHRRDKGYAHTKELKQRVQSSSVERKCDGRTR